MESRKQFPGQRVEGQYADARRLGCAQLLTPGVALEDVEVDLL